MHRPISRVIDLHHRSDKSRSIIFLIDLSRFITSLPFVVGRLRPESLCVLRSMSPLRIAELNGDGSSLPRREKTQPRMLRTFQRHVCVWDTQGRILLWLSQPPPFLPPSSRFPYGGSPPPAASGQAPICLPPRVLADPNKPIDTHRTIRSIRSRFRARLRFPRRGSEAHVARCTRKW